MRNNLAKNFLSCIFSLLLFLGAVGVARAVEPASPAPDNNQAWLSNQVRHRLVMLPWYSLFDNLEYRVDGSKVTLFGQVVQPALKSEAGSVVKSIEGVSEVDNRIEVLPPSPFDSQIRRAEYFSIFSFPSLSRYSLGTNPQIHIIVNSGHVTLEGVVSSQADKNAAGIRASMVPNVFSVTNNLRIEG